MPPEMRRDAVGGQAAAKWTAAAPTRPLDRGSRTWLLCFHGLASFVLRQKTRRISDKWVYLFLGFVPEFLSTHNRTESSTLGLQLPPPRPSLPAAVQSETALRHGHHLLQVAHPSAVSTLTSCGLGSPSPLLSPAPGRPTCVSPASLAVPSRDSACPLQPPVPTATCPASPRPGTALARWPQAPAVSPALLLTQRLQADLRAMLSHAGPAPYGLLGHCPNVSPTSKWFPVPRPPGCLLSLDTRPSHSRFSAISPVCLVHCPHCESWRAARAFLSASPVPPTVPGTQYADDRRAVQAGVDPAAQAVTCPKGLSLTPSLPVLC